MLIAFIRTIILYLLIVIALRVMGKRQVGQLEPTELVVTLMISDLASTPMGHVSIPLMHGIIPILTLIILETTLSFIDLKSRKFRKFMSGTPVILIRDGIVLEQELEHLRLNIDDLMEELRSNGNPDINEIKYAIFETNGSLNIIPKSHNRALTPKDLGIELKYKGVPFMLICDGQINEKALKIFDKDISWLMKKINAGGAKHVNDVLFASVDENGKFYMQKRVKR